MKKFVVVVKDCSPNGISYKEVEIDCSPVRTENEAIDKITDAMAYGFVAKGDRLVLYPSCVIRKITVVEVENVDDSKLQSAPRCA